MRDRDEGRYRIPDQGEIREKLARLRADEAGHADGHAFSRHVDVGPSGTRQRAQEELAAATREKRPPSDATRWTRDQYLARAVLAVERSPEYRAKMAREDAKFRAHEPHRTLQVVVRMPLREAVGPDWRGAAAGHRVQPPAYPPSRFTDNAEVVAIYRMRPSGHWYLFTCYPVPVGSRP